MSTNEKTEMSTNEKTEMSTNEKTEMSTNEKDRTPKVSFCPTIHHTNVSVDDSRAIMMYVVKISVHLPPVLKHYFITHSSLSGV